MIRWAPAEPAEGVSIDVSLHGKDPWNKLNWDYQHGQIPVPKMSGMYSECVRGLVEGLKIIGPSGKRGSINPGYFVGPGRERELKDEEWLLGWRLGSERVSIPRVNTDIIIPSFVWVLDNKVYDVVASLRQFAAKCEQDGEDLIIYDEMTNDDPMEMEFISTARVLVAHLTNSVDDLIITNSVLL